MVINETEKWVFDWYQKKWNGTYFFSRKPWKLDLSTSLTTGSHPWAWETGEEIMNDYFETFQVDKEGFNILKYWPEEPGWIPNFLLPKSMRIPYIEPEPLTLKMLVESAKAGRWIYK
ncbi:hypothetical protein Xvie_03049 [Xenorhabdus vietnamensis]|uniref:DUF1493 family protein n=1 Tax=Xenorhabdus vietnamensis TaxID=351656 RepID=A0A1Y2S8W7_9GAMM|nr:DUF1493 family protein [Xenorhabdus vietnamensis]OTA15105.1 hypothetical protein Xvie_03049 [Xenorhabdus vietnamensis]